MGNKRIGNNENFRAINRHLFILVALKTGRAIKRDGDEEKCEEKGRQRCSREKKGLYKKSGGSSQRQMQNKSEKLTEEH